jgi:hypothetical protein
VVSHVIIKADVRGSTKMTQDLLARGLSPASHFSLNLHEPVKRLLDRYSAKKVFIEGDAIILAIFETEATQGDARPVAKACALAKQILSVCNSYNDGTATTHLPPLELGIGIAFQGSAPTYWIDGDARIMISKALNLSDRLSGCAKLAKRMLAVQKTHFSVFQFLTALEGASAEELDEFLVRFNMNGVELNDEGFQKLSEEISLEKLITKLDMPWAKQDVTLYYGEVPMGESVELLVVREGLARELLPDGKIGKTSDHHYYEVCTSPVIYDHSFVRASFTLRMRSGQEAAATSCVLLSDEAAGRQIRLRQLPGVEFTSLFLIQAVEFGFHKFHIFLPGDHTFLVGIHQEQELPYLVLTHREVILWPRHGHFLRGRTAENSSCRDQDRNDPDDPNAADLPPHVCLLGTPADVLRQVHSRRL